MVQKMVNEKRLDLIDRNVLCKKMFYVEEKQGGHGWVVSLEDVSNAPTVDAVEVVHGRWERCGGDIHSSGYAVYCSVCNKTYFVHYEYSLGGLYGHKELFEKPKYCPSCGAVMDGET